MTDADEASSSDADSNSGSNSRWSLLGVAGTLSLCCLFAAPAATGAAGGTVAGGATAALGGGLVRAAVAALTVGAVAFAFRLRSGSRSCDARGRQ